MRRTRCSEVANSHSFFVFLAHTSKFRLVVGRATNLGGWRKLPRNTFQLWVDKAGCSTTDANDKWQVSSTETRATPRLGLRQILFFLRLRYLQIQNRISWQYLTAVPSVSLGQGAFSILCPLAWGAIAAKRKPRRSAWKS